ncbi:hypothetical protein KKG56_00240, partial [bacterium]|nr:hypothetical protein [bacterium]
SRNDSREVVTELIISGNTIPYIAPAAEISTICCMLLVPNSHSVTACRAAILGEQHETNVFSFIAPVSENICGRGERPFAPTPSTARYFCTPIVICHIIWDIFKTAWIMLHKM